MSASTRVPASPGDAIPAGAAPGAGAVPGAGRRRWVWPTAVGLLVVAAAALLALTVPRTRAGDLDPDSAQPSGSRAVAQILRRQGVDVEVVRSLAGLRPGPGTTLVVVRPALVPLGVLRSLERAPLTDLVLVEPDFVTLTSLDVPVSPAGETSSRAAPPGCGQPDAVAAGIASAGGLLYRVDAPVPAGTTAQQCYPDTTDPGTGSLVVVARQAATGPRRVTVIGQGAVLRNEALAQQGNAALALRLLGHQPRLQWYLPNPAELSGEQAPTLSSLVPSWLRWATLQLGVACIVALAWRARRLGKLVTEPLPVVVRAAEAQEGRARLYRQAGGRGRAAATLRTAALRRLALRFDLHADADPAVLADLVAHTTGRDPRAVRAALLGPAPGNDAALVRLADEIDAIEQDVVRDHRRRKDAP